MTVLFFDFQPPYLRKCQLQDFGSLQADRISELFFREIVLAVQVDVLPGDNRTGSNRRHEVLTAVLVLLVEDSPFL